MDDFIWVVLSKDRFPAHEDNKLSARNIDLVEVIEKISPNVYRLSLPSHIRIADIFNVKHIIPFAGDNSSKDEICANSRANHF